MEGKGLSGVADSLRTVCPSFHPNIPRILTLLQMYAPTLMRGWCAMLASFDGLTILTNFITSLSSCKGFYLPPQQVINFTLVPPQFRFVFVGVVSLVWSTFSALLD
jgi:Mpv17 / PMP22 family